MSAQHTSGPWHLERAGGYVFDIYPEGEDSGPVAADCGEADARLIAAAPDLLEALRDALADAGAEFLSVSLRAEMRAAIAKATGGQS